MTWITAHAAPRDREELARVVRAGAPGGACLVPRGGGTRLGRGTPPRAPARAVDLAALDAVVDYAVDDLTVTVEAGLPLGRLAGLLEAQRQWLPALPVVPGDGTVGGWIGADARSLLCGGCGSARDHLLRAVFVDGRGRTVAAGSRMVKSVAGYDLMKLLVGGLGSFGILVEATLRVAPRTPARVAARFPAPPPEQRAAVCTDLLRRWRPDALLERAAPGVREWIVFVSGTAGLCRAVEGEIAGRAGAGVLDYPAARSELESRMCAGASWTGWGGALPASVLPGPGAGEERVHDLERGTVWWTFPDRPARDRLGEARASCAAAAGQLHLDPPRGAAPEAGAWGRDAEPGDALALRLRDALDPGAVWARGRLPGDAA